MDASPNVDPAEAERGGLGCAGWVFLHRVYDV